MTIGEEDDTYLGLHGRARSAPTQASAHDRRQIRERNPPRTAVVGAHGRVKLQGPKGGLPYSPSDSAAFFGEPGASRGFSRCMTTESATSFYLANSLTRSIIQIGLAEVNSQSDATSALSEEPPTTGTWTSEVTRVLPGSQLASLDTTPLHSPSMGQETPQETEAAASRQTNDRPEEFDPNLSWSAKVLLQLSEQASFPKTLPQRDFDFSPGHLAALFGIDLAKCSQEQTSSKPLCRGRPSIPKLDLARVKRDEDEDDDEDEDFENKVGSEATGVKAEFMPQRPKPVEIPPLALPGSISEANEDMSAMPMQRAKSQKILPSAHPALRKSKQNLTMYCDDLTLMLLKQRRSLGRKPVKLRKASAVQLPALPKKEASMSMSQSRDSREPFEESVVHAHFHYHYHLPGLQGRAEVSK